MRKVARVLLTALTTVGLSLSLFAPPASAETTPSPTPLPTSTLSPAQQYLQYQIDLEKYRDDFKNYKIARAAYDRALIVIAMEFNRALERASRDAKMLGKSATSKASLAGARAQAAASRDQAVAELGAPPIPPIAPVPPAKPQLNNKFKDQGPRPEKKN